MIKAILTDIEGTTSSISFVKDTLFPYARKHLPAFIVTHTDNPDVQHWLHEAAKEAGLVSATQQEMIELLQKWIDEDRKSTTLKALQGMIWEGGYLDGTLKADVYPDVVPAIKKWKEKNLDVLVYSSGSVKAQQLLFRNTEHGSLESLFYSHFDTENAGPKREAESYRRIARSMKLSPNEFMFLSDIVEELDAARNAGMKTTLVARPPAVCPTSGMHPCVADFSAIVLE